MKNGRSGENGQNEKSQKSGRIGHGHGHGHVKKEKSVFDESLEGNAARGVEVHDYKDMTSDRRPVSRIVLISPR